MMLSGEVDLSKSMQSNWQLRLSEALTSSLLF